MTLKNKTEPGDEDAERGKKKRRSTYAEGFSPIDYKDASVKKLIILALAPSTETHDNMAIILDRLAITHVEFGLSADIKMILLLLGKQCATCSHPCPFCDAATPWHEDGRLTTIGSLWQNYNDFMRRGDGGGCGDEKRAKHYNNVVRAPLVRGPNEQLILGGTVFFPELHVLIGIVGKLCKEFEASRVFSSPEAGHQYIDEWLKKANIEKTKFHGSANFTGTFEEICYLVSKISVNFPGNNAEKLLDKIESLEDHLTEMLVMDEDRLDMVKKFMNAFRAFRDVVHSCFGMTLDPKYEENIQIFMAAYRELNISVPVKLHILEKHCAQFLKMYNERYGLGYFSEQAMESCHSEIKPDLLAEKLVSINHPNYGEKLVNLISRVNGKHV